MLFGHNAFLAKGIPMSNRNASFSPLQHSSQFRAQLVKLERLDHAPVEAKP